MMSFLPGCTPLEFPSSIPKVREKTKHQSLPGGRGIHIVLWRSNVYQTRHPVVLDSIVAVLNELGTLPGAYTMHLGASSRRPFPSGVPQPFASINCMLDVKHVRALKQRFGSSPIPLWSNLLFKLIALAKTRGSGRTMAPRRTHLGGLDAWVNHHQPIDASALHAENDDAKILRVISAAGFLDSRLVDDIDIPLDLTGRSSLARSWGVIASERLEHLVQASHCLHPTASDHFTCEACPIASPTPTSYLCKRCDSCAAEDRLARADVAFRSMCRDDAAQALLVSRALRRKRRASGSGHGFVKKNVQNAWVRRMKVPIETLHMVLNKHRIPYTLGRQKMHGSPGPFPRWLTEINRLR